MRVRVRVRGRVTLRVTRIHGNEGGAVHVELDDSPLEVKLVHTGHFGLRVRVRVKG